MISLIIFLITYICNFTKIRKNKHKDYNDIGLYIYKLFSIFLNFKQYTTFGDIDDYKSFINVKDTNAKRILLISNHVNLTDYINIQKFISDYYSDYMPVYIIPEKSKNIPIYGKLLNKHCILIKNNSKYDKILIQEKCQKLYYNSINNNKKYIVIIFPEGCIRTAQNIDINNRWCKENNIITFRNLINPQITGINLITENFKQEKTTLSTLIYSDDLINTKSKNIYDFLITNVARKCHIYTCDISKYFTSDILLLSTILENSIIYYIWKKQDNIIDSIYKYDIYRNHINNSNIKLRQFYIYCAFLLIYFIIYITVIFLK